MLNYTHSLTTSGFLWLLPEAWEPPALLDFFLAHRNKAEAKNPIFSKQYVQEARTIGQQWILTDGQKAPFGWAEVSLAKGHFCKAALLVEVEGPGSEAVYAFAYLLSALFIMHHVHVGEVYVPPGTSAEVVGFLEKQGGGTSICAFRLGSSEPCFTSKYTWSREAWFATSEGARCRRELAYLQLRQDRQG